MECFVYSYFKPSKITWYKDGVQIFPNRTRYSITKKKERDFIFSSTLTIRPYINTKDPGYFTCKGTNNYGTAQNVVFLPFIGMLLFLHVFFTLYQKYIIQNIFCDPNAIDFTVYYVFSCNYKFIAFLLYIFTLCNSR